MREPHSSHLRIGRVSLAQQVYLTTWTTRDRRRLFEDVMFARIASAATSAAALRMRSKVLAWVLMPDHQHALIEVAGDESLQRAVGRIKAGVTRMLRSHQPKLVVWQHGFHDHALRRDESVRFAARYLVANPVRAGLAARVGDYPYWDAVWL